MNIGEYCPSQYIIFNMIFCSGQYSPIFMQYPYNMNLIPYANAIPYRDIVLGWLIGIDVRLPSLGIVD